MSLSKKDTLYSTLLKSNSQDRNHVIWASSQQNLSLGFLTRQDLNQSPLLQRLVGILIFASSRSIYDTFQSANSKGTDQTARMHRLVCTFVLCKPLKTGFLASRPI